MAWHLSSRVLPSGKINGGQRFVATLAPSFGIAAPGEAVKLMGRLYIASAIGLSVILGRAINTSTMDWAVTSWYWLLGRQVSQALLH